MGIIRTGDMITIIIPEGKTMLDDGVEIPAPNWTICINKNDTARLQEYLTDEQITELQGDDDAN